MQQHTFIELIDKFLAGEANDAEQKLVESYLNRLEANDVELTGNTKERAVRIWEQMHPFLKNEPAPAPGRIRFLRAWKWAAAAVFLLLATGTYLWLRSGGKPQQALMQPSGPSSVDILPGTNGAILTLADGTQIALDTLNNGVIATQNGSKVLLKNGQLAYAHVNASSAHVTYNTMSTPKGQQFKVILPDGTKVWLNAASSLRFPTAFTENDRTVELKGEAYFEVAPALTADHPLPASGRRAAPFTVLVNDMKVQVLGTEFNIKAYEEEQSVKTTLVEGKVAVVLGNQTLQLSPSEQAVLTGASPILSKVTADLYKALAWKNGMFIFDDDDITDIMGELSRWYDVEVSIGGDILNSHYSGVIRRSENLSQVLDMLKTAGGINFIIENRKIKVSPDM